MRKRLTDLTVAKTSAPATGRLELQDDVVPGLVLRITSGDARSWTVRGRVKGRPEPLRLTLGDARLIPVKDAREKARDLLRQMLAGIDPRSERDATPQTVADLIEDFTQRHVARPKTVREARRSLTYDVLPVLGRKLVAAVTRWDVQAILDKMIARGAPIQANRVLAYTKQLFNFAVERGYLERSPCESIRRPSKETPIDRVLSDEELARAWRGAEAVGYPWGAITQLLILTGARRLEVGEMKWSELDLPSRTWTLPAERSKNRDSNTTHLSEPAMRVLEALPKMGAYLFSVRAGPVAGYARGKRTLDKAIGPIAPWTFHDLRRTVASGMAGLGVAPHVVDRILNHRSGVVKGVARVYQRFEYVSERAAALNLWAAHVLKLVA